ncbi:hypothetical protein [Streptomyces sp. B1I3]|uniref:hypothetical protein n=1 Tax=Streptomyces sp. B1I3 TaxID=3042264 RepID=UPI002785B0BD|nr:hypothetical protein [Streptomyces sp. B1I3]MDQ0798073.1 hypothetical protein [Streptomyces sp. B1I3]
MNSRPTLTPQQSATARSVSRAAICRRHEVVDLPKAVPDPQRKRLIPAHDLRATD